MSSSSLSPLPPFGRNRSSRSGSISRQAPSAPSARPPPKPPSNSSQSQIHLMQDRIVTFQEKYRQCRSELESYRQKNKGLERQLSSFHSKTQTIETNYANLEKYTIQISDLKTRVTYVKEKNDLLLQNKNELSRELSECHEREESLRLELDTTKERLAESEITANAEMKRSKITIIKTESKFKSLKTEYKSLNVEFLELRKKLLAQGEALNLLNFEKSDLENENLLVKDSNAKLQMQFDNTTEEYHTFKQSIEREKSDVTMAIKLATKKSGVMIKQLQKQLKLEAAKVCQLQVTMLENEDELKDLRVWKQQFNDNYTLSDQSNTQNQSGTQVSNSSDDTESVSSTHSSSIATRVHQTIRRKLSANSPIPTMGGSIIPPLISPSFNSRTPRAPPPKTPPPPPTPTPLEDDIDICIPANRTPGALSSISLNSLQSPNSSGMDISVITKEHDEVISALSNRLASVKEDNLQLKLLSAEQDKKISYLTRQLLKKNEMIADLIEKVNAKPPIKMVNNSVAMEEDEKMSALDFTHDKVMANLVQQGLTDTKTVSAANAVRMRSKSIEKRPPPPPIQGSGSSNSQTIPRVPAGRPPPLSNKLHQPTFKHTPPPIPPPSALRTHLLRKLSQSDTAGEAIQAQQARILQELESLELSYAKELSMMAQQLESETEKNSQMSVGISSLSEELQRLFSLNKSREAEITLLRVQISQYRSQSGHLSMDDTDGEGVENVGISINVNRGGDSDLFDLDSAPNVIRRIPDIDGRFSDVDIDGTLSDDARTQQQLLSKEKYPETENTDDILSWKSQIAGMKSESPPLQPISVTDGHGPPHSDGKKKNGPPNHPPYVGYVKNMRQLQEEEYLLEDEGGI